MSNSSDWPDWTTDPINVEITGEFVGFVARPFWANTTMANVVMKLAEFYAQFPNSTANSTIDDIFDSADDIAVLLGTSTAQIQDMWVYYAGDGDATGVATNIQLVGGAADYIAATRSTPPLVYAPINNAIRPVFISLSLVAAIFLLVRFYARKTSVNRILAADWMMLSGYVLTFAMGLLIVLCQNMLSYKTWPWDKTYDEYRSVQSWLCVIYVAYPFPLLAIKSSWLLFYYHLTAWRYVRWAVVATFVFTVLNTIVAFLTQLLGYLPVDFWNHYLSIHYSINPFAAFMATGALNIFTDIMIWVLPLPLVWKLALEPRERLMALATFGLGTVACIASTLRLVYIYDSYILPTTVINTPNYTAGIRLYTIVEMYLGIISGCMPSVRALIARRSMILAQRPSGLEEIQLKDSQHTASTAKTHDEIVTTSRSILFESHGWEAIEGPRTGPERSFVSNC